MPTGTDPSGYSIAIYDFTGNYLGSMSLGTSTGTIAGQDIYVIDDTTPGYASADPVGNLYPDDGIALIDGDGNVDQFISYWGNTVEANGGPADEYTSTDVGFADVGESLQSDDGGATYYAQPDTNSGIIPACYAPGTLISAPDGPKPVEELKSGDRIWGADGEIQTVRWVWSGEQPLDDVEAHQKPVLIRKSALGPNLPTQDLIVSGQHRMVVGANGQLEAKFQSPQMVPAKGLVSLPGVRFMAGKKSITWHHFVCDDHEVVFANGAASETMLLGAEVVQKLHPGQRRELSEILGRLVTPDTQQDTVLPCLSVGQTKQMLSA